MAKAKDKNKIMLIISAMLIVIAVIITCVATIYEKTSSSPKREFLQSEYALSQQFVRRTAYT